MPSVGDLYCLRRTDSGGFGVGAAAVAADDLDLGMSSQPSGDRAGFAALEYFDGSPCFKVDDDRGVDVSAAQREVIDTDDPHVPDRQLR